MTLLTTMVEVVQEGAPASTREQVHLKNVRAQEKVLYSSVSLRRGERRCITQLLLRRGGWGERRGEGAQEGKGEKGRRVSSRNQGNGAVSSQHVSQLRVDVPVLQRLCRP